MTSGYQSGVDMPKDPRAQRMRCALEGLSVGDGFGECFFRDPREALAMIGARTLPEAPWNYTDDTEMAQAIADVLLTHGEVDQDVLAMNFAQRWFDQPYRGALSIKPERNEATLSIRPEMNEAGDLPDRDSIGSVAEALTDGGSDPWLNIHTEPHPALWTSPNEAGGLPGRDSIWSVAEALTDGGSDPWLNIHTEPHPALWTSPYRGYGYGAHRLLEAICLGTPWREAAGELFDGTGSMGNGGAMRAGVVGAWFADDVDRVIEQARRSAEVTHMHPEGQAGAIAVAVAAALAWQGRDEALTPVRRAGFVEAVRDATPPGEVRDGIDKVLNMITLTRVESVMAVVGNGHRILAQDTVPLTIWCAARHLDDFVEAQWTTVAALGDRDTTCAIVGGIVALSVGLEGVPQSWRDAREALALKGID